MYPSFPMPLASFMFEKVHFFDTCSMNVSSDDFPRNVAILLISDTEF